MCTTPNRVVHLRLHRAARDRSGAVRGKLKPTRKWRDQESHQKSPVVGAGNKIRDFRSRQFRNNKQKHVCNVSSWITSRAKDIKKDINERGALWSAAFTHHPTFTAGRSAMAERQADKLECTV